MTEQTKYATIEDIKAASEAPRRYIDFTMPISKLTVKIQSMTEAEKSKVEADALNRDGSKVNRSRVLDARRRLIQVCVCEPKLERHHIELLGGFDGADLGALHTAISAHVGWSQEDIDKMEGN